MYIGGLSLYIHAYISDLSPESRLNVVAAKSQRAGLTYVRNPAPRDLP